jgi:YbgC/YbaW family acyl-CoA thioester hydrolase
MKTHHTATKRVEFSDTDMAGIVHFSKYLCYMEFAEHDFFRILGFSGAQKFGGLTYGWPRVEMKASYHQPLRFENEIEIRLRLTKISCRSLEFEFSIVNLADQLIVATGSYTTVCVIQNEDGSFKSTELPKELATRLKSHVESINDGPAPCP